MNYLKHYTRLVRRAFHSNRKRGDGNYYEGHHVKPKSLGGRIIVLLTAKEHYIAHFLLYKHYKKHGNKNQIIKSARAWKCMTFQSNDNIKRYTSRTFEYARIAFNESMKGKNHPMYGKSHSPEVLARIKESYSNMPKEKYDKMREKQRLAKLGKTWSDEQRKNVLSKREEYYKSLPNKFKITLPCGTVHLTPSLDRYVKENNMSRSLFRRFLDKGKIKNTSVINTEKINNSIDIIVETIKPEE